MKNTVDKNRQEAYIAKITAVFLKRTILPLSGISEPL